MSSVSTRWYPPAGTPAVPGCSLPPPRGRRKQVRVRASVALAWRSRRLTGCALTGAGLTAARPPLCAVVSGAAGRGCCANPAVLDVGAGCCGDCWTSLCMRRRFRVPWIQAAVWDVFVPLQVRARPWVISGVSLGLVSISQSSRIVFFQEDVFLDLAV